MGKQYYERTVFAKVGRRRLLLALLKGGLVIGATLVDEKELIVRYE